MTVRPFVGASTTTVVATTANGLMAIDAGNGRVTVTLSATTTGAIAAGSVRGRAPKIHLFIAYSLCQLFAVDFSNTEQR